MSKIHPPKEANLTPIEETIQRLMEPDKHGEKGEPARSAAFNDCFGHPVQRTLDALWKFAEANGTPKLMSEWNEEDGPVLWWRFPVVEPPYVGSPLDDDWWETGHPLAYTHWTPIPVPNPPQA